MNQNEINKMYNMNKYNNMDNILYQQQMNNNNNQLFYNNNNFNQQAINYNSNKYSMNNNYNNNNYQNQMNNKIEKKEEKNQAELIYNLVNMYIHQNGWIVFKQDKINNTVSLVGISNSFDLYKFLNEQIKNNPSNNFIIKAKDSPFIANGENMLLIFHQIIPIIIERNKKGNRNAKTTTRKE